MRSKHAEFFAKTFLFSGIGGDRIGELLRDTEIKEMRLDRGENVTQQNIKESLFFVCDGECTAERISIINTVLCFWLVMFHSVQ